ncbi:MAG: hypothetical protein AB7N99_00795 [Simkaniaceae bacterium]
MPEKKGRTLHAYMSTLSTLKTTERSLQAKQSQWIPLQTRWSLQTLLKVKGGGIVPSPPVTPE